MQSFLEVLLAMQRRMEEEYRAHVNMPGTLRDTSYIHLGRDEYSAGNDYSLGGVGD